jgi:hypothetical protein
LNGDTRCDSKPARWRCRGIFTKGGMRHDIPEKPARRDRTRVPLLCLDGPTEHMDASPPARKAHAHEIHEKAGSTSNDCELQWLVRGDMNTGLSTKPVWGRNAPVCSAELSGCAS